MDRFDWVNVECFIAAAESGSIRKAAIALGLTQPPLTRRIDRLEAVMGVRLLSRQTSGVKLTPNGVRFLTAAREALWSIEEAETSLFVAARGANELRGKIRLWLTDGFAGYWLPGHLKEFFDDFPGIQIDIRVYKEQIDLGLLQADLAIIYEEPTDPNLVNLANRSLTLQPFASPDYLTRFGVPHSVEDLRHHYFCTLADYPRDNGWERWQTVLDCYSDRVIYVTDSAIALGETTKAGVGISMQPLGVIGREPKLAPIDIGLTVEFPFWLVCHRDIKDVPRVRAFIDFVKRVFFSEDHQRPEWGRDMKTVV